MLYINHLLRFTFCWAECVIIKSEQLQAGNEDELRFFVNNNIVRVRPQFHVKSVVQISSTTNENCVKMMLSLCSWDMDFFMGETLHQFLVSFIEQSSEIVFYQWS